jgi:ABC-type glycerol-3-phosphate transport system permease component
MKPDEAFARNLKYRRLIKRILFYTALTAITIIFMLPFWIILTTSLRSRVETFAEAVVLFFKPTFVHYIRVLAEENFPRFALNSLIIAGSTTILVSYLGALAAFALTRFVF